MLASRIPGQILHLGHLLLLLPVRASLSMEAWVKSLLPNLAKVFLFGVPRYRYQLLLFGEMVE